MSEAAEILAPDQTVSILGGNLLVKELNWRDTKGFLKRLAPLVAPLVSQTADGTVAFDPAKMMAVVTDAVAEDLVVAATGKTAEEIGALPFSDFARVLDTALAINLRPEMIDGSKNVLGRLRALTGKTAGTSATPTTSSSASAGTVGSTSTPAPGDSSTSSSSD